MARQGVEMGQGDGEQACHGVHATTVPAGWSLPKIVRTEGAEAARAGIHPSACPYRLEDSTARRHWLEAYLEVLDAPDCPPDRRTYRALIDMLRLAVERALATRKSDNVVVFSNMRGA